MNYRAHLNDKRGFAFGY